MGDALNAAIGADDPSLTQPSPDLRTEVRTLARLAWPVVLGQVGLIAMGIEDLLVVGRLGEQATGAIGLGTTWMFAALAFGIGVAAGIDPLVSQAYGAGRPQDAVAALLRGSVVMLGVCMPMAAAHWWAEDILRFAGQPESIVPMAGAYCRILTAGIPAFFVFQLLRQFLQGSGRMGAATAVILLGNLLNIAGAWVLVHGAGGFAGWGPLGAAWATLAVRWCMAFALMWASIPLIRRDWPGHVLSAGAIWQTAQDTLPVGFQVSLEVWAFNAATFMAGWLGATSSAAHTVALNLASTSFMVPLGVSAAAATRVGNLVGAGRTWQRAAFTAIGSGAAVMLVSAAIFALFPRGLASMYNTDPVVVAAAAGIIPVVALFQVFDGTQAVGFGVLRGLGDTRMPSLANLVGYGMVGLPAGWILAFPLGYGLPGVWGGMTLGLATVASILVLRVRLHARRAPIEV